MIFDSDMKISKISMDAIRLLMMISVNPASQIDWSQPHKWLSRASIQIDRNLGKCFASMNIHIISPFLNEKRHASAVQ